MEMERKYFVDRLRWMAILLLFPFHAAQIYSGGEYYGFYIWSHTNMALYAFSTAVYPWYMTLLFVLAGMSCKYALSKRTIKQFIQERTKKIIHTVSIWLTCTGTYHDIYSECVFSLVCRYVLAILSHIFYNIHRLNWLRWWFYTGTSLVFILFVYHIFDSFTNHSFTEEIFCQFSI